MIINKCDICGKTVLHLDTIILYKESFDYCKNCKEKAEKIINEYKKEVTYEAVMLDSRLKSKERNILHKIKTEKNRGIILKNKE